MKEAPQLNQMNRPGVILAGVVISALGAMVYNLLPLFLRSEPGVRRERGDPGLWN